MPNNSRLLDWLLLLLCNFIWGSQFVVYKIVQKQTGPVFAVFLPMAVAALVLHFIVRSQRSHGDRVHSRCRVSKDDAIRFLILGFFGQALSKPSIAFGLRFTLASNAALVVLTLPIVIAVMAYFILGERMSKLRWISFALAILGVVETSGVRLHGFNLVSSRFLIGNLLVFGSILGSAFYNTYSKRLLSSYSPLEVLLYSYYAALMVLFPFVLIVEPESFAHITHFPSSFWWGIVFLAIIDYALAMVILLTVLSRLDAIQVSLSNYLMPFFGLLVAALVLHERLNKFMIAGGLLVLCSTVLITIYDRPKKKLVTM